MGRSVSYPRNTYIKTFRDVTELHDTWDWQDFTDDLICTMQEYWPSLKTCSKWIGREDHAIVENSFVYMGVSEYCGLACIWVAIKEDAREELATRWCDQIKDKFIQSFGEYYKVATFSNGEGVYEKINKTA